MEDCIYYLLTQRRQHTKQHTCPDPCSLVVCIFLVILFSFVILAIRNYFYSHSFLPLFLHLSIIWRQITDIVMTSKWFCHHFIEPNIWVAWGKFVHSLGWRNFGHPNTLWTVLNTTHRPLQLIVTFPNCNISFIMDQSTNKTTNEWLLQVAQWENLFYFWSLAIRLAKNKKPHSVGCTKSKDRHTVRRSCLFWSSVFATICPLKNLPNFRHFDDVVLNLRIHS